MRCVERLKAWVEGEREGKAKKREEFPFEKGEKKREKNEKNGKQTEKKGERKGQENGKENGKKGRKGEERKRREEKGEMRRKERRRTRTRRKGSGIEMKSNKQGTSKYRNCEKQKSGKQECVMQSQPPKTHWVF